jgi:hypothetical protein
LGLSGLVASRTRIIGLLCFALSLTAALAASPALAARTHQFTGTSFGSDGTSATSFNSLRGVAVDPANGDVYAYDAGAGEVYKFDASGNPVNFSALGSNAIKGVGGALNDGENEIAIAPPGSPGGTGGDIYVANNGFTIYSPSGTKLGELGGGPNCGVATSPSGHVFVGSNPSAVKEFVPSANPVLNRDQTAASSAPLGEICSVAADGLGNVYAADLRGSGVLKLAGLGAPSATRIDPEGRTLAVDPSSNDVYVDRGSSVAQYNSSSAQLGVFGSGQISESSGIAVNGASGNVYVDNGGSGRVDVFGPAIVIPGVSAKPATAEVFKATLHGSVNPDGLAVGNCEFEYGTTTAYGKTAPCEGAIPTDSNDHPVSAALTGLEPSTTYHFRLAATNANGTNSSGDLTFTTNALVNTGEATNISGAKATLNGVVFPEGEAVSNCEFEYGNTTAYGKTAPCVGAIPTDEGGHAVSAALTHLVPNGTIYHFRLVIERAGEEVQGSDRSFGTAETVITGAATAIHPPSATIEGTVNPEGTLLTECAFEYGTSTEPYGSSVPCAESPATIGTGTDPVSVHADLGGLAFEATYHYRLKATNADGTAHGEDRSFRTPGAPAIGSQQLKNVTDTEAELGATINPKGLLTTYRFEYGTTTAYGQSTAETEVGADEENHEVVGLIGGLTPDTTYHWRVVATNSHAVTDGIDRTFTTFSIFNPETNCPNQALRTAASAALPDCRAYEMVSPAQKAGEVFPPSPFGGTCNQCTPGEAGEKMPMQASPDGETIVYEGQPFAEGLASRGNQYLARRSAGGWATQGLSSPLTSSLGGVYEGFSADLSRGVLHQGEPALSPEAPSKEGKAYANLYLYEEGKALRPLVTQAPPNHEPGEFPPSGEAFRIRFGDGNSGTKSSAAYSHLVFTANGALTGPTANAPAAVEATNLYEWVDGQLRLVNVAPGNATTVPGAVLGSGFLSTEEPDFEAPVVEHAISADGSHIFWSDGTSGQLYVRIDGEETKKIEDPGLFLTATPDGSKVLLSDGCLYDLAEEECEADLTGGKGDFQGILGNAEDLSRVYFVDTAALTPPSEENANHEHAEAEKFNLYAWHEGTTGFLGTLAGEVVEGIKGPIGINDNSQAGFDLSGGGDWKASIRNRTAQVSPDGRYLTFMSMASLTGYDNIQRSGAPTNSASMCSSEKGCAEVFEYDADSGELDCVSCNPSNIRPLGRSALSLVRVQGNTGPSSQPGNLSAEGRIFFESQDALTSRDNNGQIQDIYEWKPEGVGGCNRAAGCLALISSGQSPNDSFFVDSTSSGSDIFFITREQLLLKDQDEQLDLYDARADGGISEAKAPPCQGEACKGPASSATEAQSPGSAGFVGPGNEKPKKQKHKKKSHKKKAHKHKSKAHKRAAKHNRGGSK